MHPQTNGHTERFNKTLIAIIAMFVSAHQKDWDELISYALYAYNTSIHPTTQESPFFLMFVRTPKTIEDLLPEPQLKITFPLRKERNLLKNSLQTLKRK